MSDNPDPPAEQSEESPEDLNDGGWPEEADDQLVMRRNEATKAEPEAPSDESEEASGESEND